MWKYIGFSHSVFAKDEFDLDEDNKRISFHHPAFFLKDLDCIKPFPEEFHNIKESEGREHFLKWMEDEINKSTSPMFVFKQYYKHGIEDIYFQKEIKNDKKYSIHNVIYCAMGKDFLHVFSWRFFGELGVYNKNA